MKKNRARKIREQQAIRLAHRIKRRDGEEERRRAAKGRNRLPPGIRTVIRPGFRKPLPDPAGEVSIPRVFSLLQHPEAVLRICAQLEYQLGLKHKKRIRVDHSRCVDMDLGASILLDNLVVAAEKQRKGTPRALEVEGQASFVSQKVNVMLFASGLPHHLGLNIELPHDIKSRIRTFEQQSGTASHVEKAKQRNKCATDLTIYFNECLRTKGYELSGAGRANLGNLITEVIGNAEEHGGPWHAIGFYDDTALEEQGGAGECHIVIFNYGKTIYETLHDPLVSTELKEKLHELSAHHQPRNKFARYLFGNKGEYTEECLWTLYALQDRVTRFYRKPGGEDRGVGTVKMIEFFEQLAVDAPMRMCVLSGSAYILFDGKHRIRPSSPEPDAQKIIAFNEGNDLRQPPDPKYVRGLEIGFPGTIVSIKLKLDRSSLDRTIAQGTNRT